MGLCDGSCEDATNERIEEQSGSSYEESLVNLKRNLRSVIPAYGFTPIGVAEGRNFCALVRERKAKRTRGRLMDQPVDLETSTTCME